MTHRWLAIVLGVVLLAVCTSGCVLLYLPQLDRLAHPGLYRTTHGRPIPATRALAIARADRSRIVPATATLRDGAWVVSGSVPGHGEVAQDLHIDAATGRVLGLGSLQGGVLGWIDNFHDCGMSCPTLGGYVSWLAAPVPLPGNPDLAVGTLALGVAGLLLVWLVISGLWLWWPRIRRFVRGFVVRRRRGAYALNYDLHKVIGIASLPFLAMWALTGTGFELSQVQDAWYGLLPGAKPPAYAPPVSTGSGPTISPEQAERAAVRAVPGTVRAITLPAAGERTSAYDVAISSGFDPRTHSVYQGDVDVGVDRYTGAARVDFPTDWSRHRPLAQSVWQDWQFAAHAGTPIDGWWRLIWLAFGLSPLALAVTAIVTWWTRRRKRRRRRSLDAHEPVLA